MDRQKYEEDLRRRQKEHLDNMQRQRDMNWRPCMHDSCPTCHGTGVDSMGRACVHSLSCPCPKCTSTF